MAFSSIAFVVLSGIAFFTWQGGSHLTRYFPCPTSCRCRYPWFMRGSFVDCSNLALVAIPADIPCNAVELDLSKNHLTQMPNLRRLPRLKKLDIAQNKLCDRGAETLLADCTQLEELRLSKNQLTRFPTGLPQTLIRLDISDNLISSLKCSLLTALPPLRVLVLARNKLSVLTRDSFCPPFGEPPPLAAVLRHLDLSGNNIHILEEGVFRCLTQLERLNLSGNLFTILGPRDFQGLTTLRSLDLSCNSLLQIADGTLSSMTSLQYLNLERNQLTTVPRHLPTSIKLLDLSNNAITVISEDPNLLQISRIFVAHNPLLCDCRLRWIKDHLIKSVLASRDSRCSPEITLALNETKLAHLTPRCSNPPPLAGQLISQVDDSALVCCDEGGGKGKGCTIFPVMRKVSVLPPRKSSKSIAEFFHSQCACPRMPDNPWVWIRQHNGSTLIVEWNIPPALEGYTLEVQFHIFGFRDCKIAQSVPIEKKQLYLNDLKPETNYMVCVMPRHCPLSETPILLESCFEVTTSSLPPFHRMVRSVLGSCSCKMRILGLIILGLIIAGLALTLSQMKYVIASRHVAR